MNTNPLVHIVIPLYNEAKVLADSVTTLIDFLEKSSFPYRYILTLANNASIDRSALICQELADKFSQVKVLNLTEKGKGRAIRTAWSSSTADILTFMDTDLASDLNYFKPLIDAVALHGYDMSIGSRLGKDSLIDGRRVHREFISRCYNAMIRLLFHTGIADHQCGFKAITRKAYQKIEHHLEDNRWFLDTEMIVWAKRKNFKIKQVDIVWIDRSGSKVSVPKTSYELLKSALALRFRKPNKITQ